jgi:cytidylate kinase
VVFPDAQLKVFLDASLDARAERRHRERGDGATLQEIREQIARRDRIDATKAVGRLKVHPSALYINTSDLTVDQVCDIVLRAILRQKPRNRSY